MASLYLSDAFVISCGTVTVDTERSKVLIVRNRAKQEYVLPKGRKDVGETLEQAALRETFEETGFQVKMLPLSCRTLATLPTGPTTTTTTTTTPTAQASQHTEPIAVTQRMLGRVLKTIFWFAATADSKGKPQVGTQMEDEDFEPCWASTEEVCSMLSFEDDQKVTTAVLAAAHDFFLSNEV